jgi:hypothetical protein
MLREQQRGAIRSRLPSLNVLSIKSKEKTTCIEKQTQIILWEILNDLIKKASS